MTGQILALLGAVLVATSALGVARFGDLFSRMHALAKGSTLGILLIFTGAALNVPDVNGITTVVLAGIVYVVTLPPASNVISRAAYRARRSNEEAGIPRVATGRDDDETIDVDRPVTGSDRTGPFRER